MIGDVDDESLGFHINQALTMSAIRLGRNFCSVFSRLVLSLLRGHIIGIMDAHASKIDIPDLTVPAMGTDTGSGAADYPPANLPTLVPHGAIHFSYH